MSAALAFSAFLRLGGGGCCARPGSELSRMHRKLSAPDLSSALKPLALLTTPCKSATCPAASTGYVA